MTIIRGPADIEAAEMIDDARRDLAAALAGVDAARQALTEAVNFARDRCRWTWAEVGAVMGTTRQAAQERFSKPADG